MDQKTKNRKLADVYYTEIMNGGNLDGSVAKLWVAAVHLICERYQSVTSGC